MYITVHVITNSHQLHCRYIYLGYVGSPGGMLT